MKTKIISKILLTLGLVLVLGSVVTPMHGGTQPSSASVIGPPDQQFPVVTIHSTDNVTRGKIGTFVLSVNPEKRARSGSSSLGSIEVLQA